MTDPQHDEDSPEFPCGVTAPRGFLAAGVAAHLKPGGERDVALVLNRGPQAASAGVFTSNRVVAAPVTLTRRHLNCATLRAVILNSGGANACTGEEGLRDATLTAYHTAESLGLSPEEIGVCSTGLIGERLPTTQLLAGVSAAVSALATDPRAALQAADAIRTTDTVPKTVVVYPERNTSADVGSVDTETLWCVGGMAKGAGMLAPGLATMLVVLTTDAVVSSEDARTALEEAIRTTFNRIDSDGCMSTNDTVLLLASGASGVSPSLSVLTETLREACADLARQLIGDAEGASHEIEITVSHASDETAAEIVAKAVARSNLFKTAVFGNDPNWGRVVAEVGTVPEEVAPFDPGLIDVSINGVMVCRRGGLGDRRELVDMSPRRTDVLIDLHAGTASVSVLTNDLTTDYVHENSAYSS